MLVRYNFGADPDLLFRPCDAVVASDGDGDGCYIDGDGRLYAYDPVIRLPDQDVVEEADTALSESPVGPNIAFFSI